METTSILIMFLFMGASIRTTAARKTLRIECDQQPTIADTSSNITEIIISGHQPLNEDWPDNINDDNQRFTAILKIENCSIKHSSALDLQGFENLQNLTIINLQYLREFDFANIANNVRLKQLILCNMPALKHLTGRPEIELHHMTLNNTNITGYESLLQFEHLKTLNILPDDKRFNHKTVCLEFDKLQTFNGVNCTRELDKNDNDHRDNNSIVSANMEPNKGGKQDNKGNGSNANIAQWPLLLICMAAIFQFRYHWFAMMMIMMCCLMLNVRAQRLDTQLSRNNIPINSALTKEFFQMDMLPTANIITEIHLEWDGLTSIQKDAFSPFASLTHLYLPGNKLTKLDAELDIPLLRELDLSHNDLVHFDHSFVNAHPQLKTLSLAGNHLLDIDWQLSDAAITRLSLSDNEELSSVRIDSNSLRFLLLARLSALEELVLNTPQLRNVDVRHSSLSMEQLFELCRAQVGATFTITYMRPADGVADVLDCRTEGVLKSKQESASSEEEEEEEEERRDEDSESEQVTIPDDMMQTAHKERTLVNTKSFKTRPESVVIGGDSNEEEENASVIGCEYSTLHLRLGDVVLTRDEYMQLNVYFAVLIVIIVVLLLILGKLLHNARVNLQRKQYDSQQLLV